MVENTLSEALGTVCDEQSFIRFAERMAADAPSKAKGSVQPWMETGGWENTTLKDFLSAACSWVEDSDFGARPGPKSVNPWQQFAMSLWAGRSYE
ncbi:MAG: hypothetical protein E6Q49_03850 [Limnohabitans sp.]|nr:MAG: hypothetical protein E6Q49_03850 [Limnohabitans sp.]